MIDTLNTLIAGPLMPVLSGVGGGIMGFFKNRQANKHEIKMAEMATTAKQYAADARADQARIEGAYKEASTSLEHVHMWVNDVKALVRPALIFWVSATTSLLYFYTGDPNMKAQIIMLNLSLLGLGGGFYFGGRLAVRGTAAGIQEYSRRQ